MRSYGKLLEILAGVIALGAGIYLLQEHSIATGGAGQSWFEVLAHGIGAYFVARGIWMIRQAGKSEDVVDRLDRLIELEESEPD